MGGDERSTLPPSDLLPLAFLVTYSGLNRILTEAEGWERSPLWVKFTSSTPGLYAQVLVPSISECDLIRKWGDCGWN